MSADREKQLFLEGFAIESPVERAAFLDRACAGDSELRQRVDALFEAQRENRSFLEHPPIEVAATEILADTVDEADEGRANSKTAPYVDEIPLDFLDPPKRSGSIGRLGQYDVLEAVGRGGMGIVLKAHDSKLNRVVAVKILAPELASNATARKRFAREAQAAAAVSHDHVVTIHAVDEGGGASGLPFLVMEYIDGESLQQKIDREGQLELREILRIGRQIAAGLAAAHEQGLIHRDVKPSNILLQNSVQRVQITDFGLARATDDVGMTKSGEVTGTPQYMSPEQAQGLPVDTRSDLFSLGSVLYAMCTGRSPFRAETSVASLRRVCDDTPRPIREINPDVPDWLVEIIDRLLEKDPDERFQNAEEVAELLGRHLAHVQDPGSTPVPGVTRALPQPAPRTSGNRQRWLVAGLVLLAVGVTFSMTEATGVTQLSATVVRIVTGEGTLVIEVDDPGVQVSLDGEELSITGAGLQEIRLRPGQYQFQATKDGEPVKRELVTITRGDRRVVRVTRETDGDVSGTRLEEPAAHSTNAFVVLGGDGEATGKFGALADAVRDATPGDTIEIHSNGTFETESVVLRHPLRLKAGEGFRPVLRLGEQSAENSSPLLDVRAPLVLEGIELQRMGGVSGGKIVECPGPHSLHITNCRFVTDTRPFGCCIRTQSQKCIVRNTEFMTWAGFSCVLRSSATTEFVMSNCIGPSVTLSWDAPSANRRSIQLDHNTFVTDYALAMYFQPGFDVGEDRTAAIDVQASHNVFDCADLLMVVGVEPDRISDSLPAVVTWTEEGSLYAGIETLLSARKALADRDAHQPLLQGENALRGWKQLWDLPDAWQITGDARYEGGDVRSIRRQPERLIPEDFRLRPESPGFQAGPNGEDLGANVDLVGPGEAYERWKLTDEYRSWTEETDAVTAGEVVRAQQPFVVLGSDGRTAGKFGSLAHAVLGSTPGDTIEIRGDGPFVTETIEINHPLKIVAGNGFRPVIRDDPQSPPAIDRDALLWANAPLVLEGLEFETTHPDTHKVVAALTSLSAVNCRFLALAGSFAIFLEGGGHSALRNCEMIAVCPLSCRWKSLSAVDVENCLIVGHINFDDLGESSEYLMSIRNSTVLNCEQNCSLLLFTMYRTPSPEPVQAARFQASGSVLDSASPMMTFAQPRALVQHPLGPEEAQAWLKQRIIWRADHNLYRTRGAYLDDLVTSGEEDFTRTELATDRAAWNQFWTLTDTDSVEDLIRYQGGDLHAKARSSLGQLTPEDFRLRPDSVGYQGGPNGEDLGANIDFVGPGEAYERWKQTDAHNRWEAAIADLLQVKKNAQARTEDTGSEEAADN